MLKFQRNKLVSIYQDKPDELRIHGLLDDHIFGLEIDIKVRLDDLTIRFIDGKWNREETPECSRALPFLQEAKGFRIDGQDLGQRINKSIGRKSCPHFANLLLECCTAAKEAVQVINWTAARAERPDLTYEAYAAGAETGPAEKGPLPSGITMENSAAVLPEEKKPRLQPPTDGFVVDLHTHSFPASPCSSMGVDELIREAKRIQLDAVCLTDHNHVWDPKAIEDLSQKHGFAVFRGNEITTDEGDMLVFGMHARVKGIIKLADLKKMVDDAGGFLIAAHPFRGFLVFNASQIGLTVDKAMERSAYHQVHALETLNGKVTETENRFAGKVAEGLNLPATGGSDAHEISGVGKYATRFRHPIENEAQLVRALKSGQYAPCAFRVRLNGSSPEALI
jgi:predicted metal-dependent phosphoesterase TrpH